MSRPAPPIPPGTSLAGKTAIVTGGNSGLGFEVARQALELRASRVIITTRSPAKGKAAVAALAADPQVQSTNPTAKLEFFDLDLDDYQSGLRFSQQVKQEVPELDLLLCNGGVNFFHYETSKSGHEKIMQVNCYTHFLIVLHLLPLLRATAAQRGSPTRVTFVGSYSHLQHTLKESPIAAGESILGHYDNKKAFRALRRYQNSKLVINAFVQRLATVLPSSEVIVNNVCPGVVATNFARNLPLWIRPGMYIYFKLKGRTIQEGARIIVRAAVVVGEESHGRFVQDNRMDSGAPFLAEPAGKQYTEKLWAEIVADTIKVYPGINGVH